MADPQQSKVNVTLKSTDTSRFKVGPQDAPSPQPPVQLTDSGKIAATVTDPNSLRDTPTGRLKKVSDTNPVVAASATQMSQPTVKTETVQLKVLREKRTDTSGTAGVAASSTIRLRPAAAATSSLNPTTVAATKPAEPIADDADARRTVRIKPLSATTQKPASASTSIHAPVTDTTPTNRAEPVTPMAVDTSTVVQPHPDAGGTIKLQAAPQSTGGTIKVTQPEAEPDNQAKRTLKLQRPGGGKTMKMPGEDVAASAGSTPSSLGVHLSAEGVQAQDEVGAMTVVCTALTAIALAVAAVISGMQLLKHL